MFQMPFPFGSAVGNKGETWGDCGSFTMNAVARFAGMFCHKLLPTDDRRIGFGNSIQIIQGTPPPLIIRLPNRSDRFDGFGLLAPILNPHDVITRFGCPDREIFNLSYRYPRFFLSDECG